MTNATSGADKRLPIYEINPLIAGDGWGEDTANNVCCVLEFLADAVAAIVNEDCLSIKSANGMCLILNACRAAVSVPVP